MGILEVAKVSNEVVGSGWLVIAVIVGSGWLEVVAGVGWLVIKDGGGWLVIVAVGDGWLMVVVGGGWLVEVAVGSGSLVVVAVGGGWLVAVANSYTVENETALLSQVLTDYAIGIRPSNQVNVTCGLRLNNILKLDIVEQTLSVMASLTVIWKDGRLSWNPGEWMGLYVLYPRNIDVWKPVIVHANSAVGISVLGDDSNKNSIPVALAATGDLYWMAPLYLVSFCQIDVSKFPFDTQTCDIEFSTWMLDEAVLSLRHSSEDIVLEEYTENGEFVIESTTTLKKDKIQLQYVNIKALVYRLVLRRRSTYYIVNLVLPVMLLQVLGVLVFKIPASSGEKLSFSLTMLLSLTVLMTMVSAMIPTTSLQVSVFCIYLLCGAVASALEVVITVVILYLNSHGEKRLTLFPCSSERSRVVCSRSTTPSLDITCVTVGSLDGCEFKDKTMLEINDNCVSNKQNNRQNEFSSEARKGKTYEELAKNIDNVCFVLFSIFVSSYSIAYLFSVVL
ncbi:acetylcholine receptor subunit alpha-like [Dreissena polymorpha]|uniref:acetylcholine receptor subunit alpha-like n=1 Tax=Dreissena polymorpha TaxID=45954 RepID=UPI0022643007|nr:acetylcholine receptor subunit alpha-like [Dreissena polymorpha]